MLMIGTPAAVPPAPAAVKDEGTWARERGAMTWGKVATPPPPARPTMAGEASSGNLDPMVVVVGMGVSWGASTRPWDRPAWM